jgi:hypothetical protein
MEFINALPIYGYPLKPDNDLTQARTRISDAILDLCRGIAPTAGAIIGDIVSNQVERGVGCVERVATDLP